MCNPYEYQECIGEPIKRRGEGYGKTITNYDLYVGSKDTVVYT